MAKRLTSAQKGKLLRALPEFDQIPDPEPEPTFAEQLVIGLRRLIAIEEKKVRSRHAKYAAAHKKPKS